MKNDKLSKFSIGIGDRFSHQAVAQLKAVQKAADHGVRITPVWNKSFREHQIIGSKPETTREMADRAVRELDWAHAYFLDADHINLSNVDLFMDSSDFFTIDVADYIGQSSAPEDVRRFVETFKGYTGKMELPGTGKKLSVTEDVIRNVAEKYMFAVRQAGKIYRHIRKHKGGGTFIAEVSMDETDTPQSPVELFFILAALAEEKIPVQTIAPKFSGRFNKGVDYVGDVATFRAEFEQDVAVLKVAMQTFDLPASLKLSVHSGSDKFSIYPAMREVMQRHDAGIHIKTAGTTWLEEVIGLAEAGGSGLELAKEIYLQAFNKAGALCAPYASVIDINRSQLPRKEDVAAWSASEYTAALRHDQQNPGYNMHFRQLLHVGYKVAAEMGERFLAELRKNEVVIEKNVTENIYERHIKPLFL